jgi:hypothetical protein
VINSAARGCIVVKSMSNGKSLSQANDIYVGALQPRIKTDVTTLVAGRRRSVGSVQSARNALFGFVTLKLKPHCAGETR